MKTIFFTPGPSQLFPTVKKHVERAMRDDILSISHRSKKFQGIYLSATDGLRKLLAVPKNHRIFFVSSGTEAMERIIQNIVLKNSFHFVNGAFSKRFYKTSQELLKNVQKLEVPMGEGFLFEKSNIPKETEVICFTQNETSTGVALPLDKIYKVKKKNPSKLIALDIVSSAPYVDIDFTKIDLAFFSVQKGFGLPAGLGILVVSPVAFEKAVLLQKRTSTGSYHSFLSLEEFALKNQTPETPNVLAIYLLGKVVEDLLRYSSSPSTNAQGKFESRSNKSSRRATLARTITGIEAIRKETEAKAKRLYDFFDAHKVYKPFVSDKKFRSQTVITISTPNGSGEIVEKLKEKGIIVDRGYGELKERQIRIANFPAHTRSDVEQLLKHIV